jgi:hypothetical protein
LEADFCFCLQVKIKVEGGGWESLFVEPPGCASTQLSVSSNTNAGSMLICYVNMFYMWIWWLLNFVYVFFNYNILLLYIYGNFYIPGAMSNWRCWPCIKRDLLLCLAVLNLNYVHWMSWRSSIGKVSLIATLTIFVLCLQRLLDMYHFGSTFCQVL